MTEDRITHYEAPRHLKVKLGGATVLALTLSPDATVKPTLHLSTGLERKVTCSDLRAIADTLYAWCDEQMGYEK